MIIDENQLSSAHNISNTTTFETTNKTTPPTTIDQNSYCSKLAPISAQGTTSSNIVYYDVNENSDVDSDDDLSTTDLSSNNIISDQDSDSSLGTVNNVQKNMEII